jgi:hypothetical protein
MDMKRLLFFVITIVIASTLVVAGCDQIKGLFGGKPQGQGPQIGAPPGGSPQSPDLFTASVNGKYSNLLKTLNVPGDQAQYGNFYEWGYWNGNAYAGYSNLPPGYWVYVYPNWYVWGSTK